MRKRRKGILILIAILIYSFSAIGQVSISGPTCVFPGVIYQYKIIGNWDSTSTMQVCVTGGIIADSSGNNNCSMNGAPLAAVLVKWNTGASGSMTIKSIKGNSNLGVSITSKLKPGLIDSAAKMQIVSSNTVPFSITCSIDSGGSCSPSFSYQWQLSADNRTWIDISGATSRNLNFSSPLTMTTFYRKKITETVSGTIVCSEVAIINVYSPIP